ncbi:lipase 3-like [Pectinophora gossypiella]|uniref:lipase 3-like n=1 Tax=Pectinophora gossypiella TaxID=13191 RepID=UPI00214E6188|nr:lipase 3-like [Pectinophora gossypiella]
MPGTGCADFAIFRSFLVVPQIIDILCNSTTALEPNASPKVTSVPTGRNELVEFINTVLSVAKPKLTLEALIGDISLDHIAEYEEGVKTGDQDLNITQLLKKYGYKSETHYVTTRDGYILKIFRIPSNGTIVYLEHGFLSNSDDWVVTGPDTGLAYLLADAGYDVWIGNARGNKHCQQHVRLSPDDEAFWNFSWDEIGRYDLPAVIDYILELNEKPNLIYIGHSQGTTAFFVLCSELPEYNKKISFMVALAPVAWMSHTTSPLFQYLAPFAQDDNSIMRKVLGPSISHNDPLTAVLKAVFCNGNIIKNILCNNIMFLFMGFDNAQLNYRALATINNHSPGGAATKQLEHFAQSIESGYFRRFDYKLDNVEMYGYREPPRYEVEKITVPMAIFHALADWVADRQDLEILMAKLRNHFTFHIVPYENFAHLDFLYARDVAKLVYRDVLQLLKGFTSFTEK